MPLKIQAFNKLINRYVNTSRFVPKNCSEQIFTISGNVVREPNPRDTIIRNNLKFSFEYINLTNSDIPHTQDKFTIPTPPKEKEHQS